MHVKQAVKALQDADLPILAQRFDRWARHPGNADKTHAECLYALATAHAQHKRTRRTDGFLTRAGFSPTMAIANVWTDPRRGLTPRTLANLATCAWVDAGHSLVILGDHGAGKTFLAAALAREAALTGSGVRYRTLSNLFQAYEDAAPGKQAAVLRPVRNARLLILDHLAEDHIPAALGTMLRDLLEERARAGRATVFVSGHLPGDWAFAFENPETGEVIHDRIVREATVIHLVKEWRSLPEVAEGGQDHPA
jgi:DNA replication protein DnaC